MLLVPFPKVDVVAVRLYRIGDAQSTLAVFREAVRRGAADHYDERQRFVWSRAIVGLEAWRASRVASTTWVAEVRGEIVGFTDLTDAGEIDMLYVHPDRTRRGVGKALLDEAEREARARDHLGLRTHASLVAEPLFAREGFVVLKRQHVALGREELANALMEKFLEPA